MSDLAGISSPPWSVRTRRTVVILLLVVAGIFAWRLADIWPPIVVSLVLAYLLSPLVGLVQRLLPFGGPGLRRTLATALTFVLVLAILILLLLVLVPAIVAQLRQFGEGLPALADQIERDLGRVLDVPIAIGGQTIVPLDIIRSLAGNGTSVDFDFSQVDLLAFAQQFVGPLTVPVLGALGTAVSGALSTIFVVTMMFYLMKDGPYFVTRIEGLFEERYQGDVRWLFQSLGQVWNAYLRGQFVLCVTMGVVVFITASLLGVRNPLVLGLLSGLLEFIPNLGPALALLPAAAFALFFPSATIPGLQGVVFMLVVIVAWTGLQNLEAIFLVPRIMGDNLDLHPFVVIVAVIGGASLSGALGVILAAPVVASLRVLGEYLLVKLFDRPWRASGGVPPPSLAEADRAQAGRLPAGLGVRPVTAADRPAVMAIAAQVWDGDDYLPRVFDDWLADPDGVFYAATLDGQLAGVAKLSRMDEGQWWMEGLRVAPAFRGQGIGRFLHDTIVAYARAHVTGVLRFSTASDNTTSIHLGQETGFAQVAVFAAYGAEAEAGEAGRLRPLGPDDLQHVLAFLDSSTYYAASHGTLENSWRFRPLTPGLLRERLAAGLVYGWLDKEGDALAGLIVINARSDHGEDDEEETDYAAARLYVGYLDARPDQREALARAVRHLAHDLGRERVSLKVVEEPAVLAALEAAGYERRWGDMSVLLFERKLSEETAGA